MTYDTPHRAASSLGFRVFTLAYALYACLNTFFMLDRYDVFLTSGAIFALSIILIYTGSVYALLLIAVISVIECAIVFPSSSNHLFMAVFLNAGIIISTVQGLCARSRSPTALKQAIYDTLAPYGRSLLLVLYFWGTFHKLNTEFIDPKFSYASLLLHYFPLLPETIAHNYAANLVAIYGTLFIEFALIVLAFSQRNKHIALALCAIFHLIISINLFRVYIPFSLLSMALYTFFLPPRAFASMTRRFSIIKKTDRALGIVAIALFIMFTGFLFWDKDSVVLVVRWAWIPILLMITGLVFIFCRTWRPHIFKTKIVSPLVLLNMLALIFLANGASPYIGLKSGQSMEMFSNLRTENSHTNHLIVTRPLYIFSNLKHTVRIISTSHPELKKFSNSNLEINKFVLKYHMANRPYESVVYEQYGVIHSFPNGISAERADRWRKPLWLYKIFSFKPISIEGRAT